MKSVSSSFLLLFVWIAISFRPLSEGEWWGYLLFGAGWLLLIRPGLFPFRDFDHLMKWGRPLGALFILFSVWRLVPEIAMKRRVQECEAAKNLSCLLQEDSLANSPGEKRITVQALDRTVATKAKGQFGKAVEMGDRPFVLTSRCFIWDTKKDSLHGAQALLPEGLGYHGGEGPITIFLTDEPHSQRMGTYSISRQAAYRELVNVCFLQFDDIRSPVATPGGCHEVTSLDPISSKPVDQSAEHGDPNVPIAEWVKSLRVGYR